MPLRVVVAYTSHSRYAPIRPMNPLSKDACPACGQPNQCAMAEGADPQGCWCMQTPVSRAALARLPAQERGQRCICPVCARESDPVPVAVPAQHPAPL